MNPTGFKVMKIFLKGVKIENFHGVLTADDNTSRICTGRYSRLTVIPLYNISLERRDKVEEYILSGQSMSPPG